METRILQAFQKPIRPGMPPPLTSHQTAPTGSMNFDAIEEAAHLLSSGEVVAIPTETVYGLAGNALDANAVRKIYEAKGRPATNPLIVHVESAVQASHLAICWSESAELLASAFWPGPLTMVLQKKPGLIPDITTAEGETVALRCPRHHVALELIRHCGFPLAAPSANRSNALSPTTAIHVQESLGGRIPLILDGGPCTAGIESTVLDLISEQPRILRPGVLSANFLSEILQQKVLEPQPGSATAEPANPSLSPGQMPVHYAPKTPLFLARRDDLPAAIQHLGIKSAALALMILENKAAAAGTAHLKLSADRELLQVIMPSTPGFFAQNLYATLHELDGQNLDAIICELPPETQEWLAINDRLLRAGQIWK